MRRHLLVPNSAVLRWIVAVAVCFGLVGCSVSGDEPIGTNTGGGGSDAQGASSDGAGSSDLDVPDLLPGQICVPGSVKACVIEGGKLALICNESGTNWKEDLCKGSEGNDSSCVNGACTECVPGDRRCDGEDLVVECSETGMEWLPYSQCQGGTTGQICNGTACESLCSINFKFNSYIGCDYWGVDLDNAFVSGGSRGYFDAAGAQYAIAVANPPESPVPTLVEVWYKEGGIEKKVPFDSAGLPIESAPLQPGELRVYRLPKRDVNGTIQAPLAYRITATAPIIAYQFNPLENENVFSNDASLLLPATLMGQEYIVMTREQTFDVLRSFLTVAAVLPGETTVSVQVSAPTMVGAVYPGAPDEEPIPHMEAGETRIFKLDQYDVLNIETDRPGADLTGSIILTDQRVAVFGGSEASNAPNDARCVDHNPITGQGVCEYDGSTPCTDLMDCVYAGFNTCCADHLEQQLFPVSTWGTIYVATKSWDRGQEEDIWRIMAAEDNTQVVLVPAQQGISVPILNAGEWFEFESRNHFEIHSVDSKPILVGQFLAAQDAPEPNIAQQSQAEDAGTGDPAFMLAVPFEQYRESAVILTPAEYEENFVNITCPTGSTVTVDGEEIPPGYFELVGSGTYSVYRHRITKAGAHTITSSEPAGVIVYGYDQYVSYGYTGGLDLAKLNDETIFGAVSGDDAE